MPRNYESTHPWLKFTLDLRHLSWDLWVMLGECQSKCEHIAGTPLRPDLSKALHTIYLAKGVAATTAIEGNTLSEQQVRQQIEGKLQVPPSKEYLKQEEAASSYRLRRAKQGSCNRLHLWSGWLKSRAQLRTSALSSPWPQRHLICTSVPKSHEDSNCDCLFCRRVLGLGLHGGLVPNGLGFRQVPVAFSE